MCPGVHVGGAQPAERWHLMAVLGRAAAAIFGPPTVGRDEACRLQTSAFTPFSETQSVLNFNHYLLKTNDIVSGKNYCCISNANNKMNQIAKKFLLKNHIFAVLY